MKKTILWIIMVVCMAAGVAVCLCNTEKICAAESAENTFVKTGRRTYQITSETAGEAAFVKTTSTSPVITIPAEVCLNGRTYKVTGISARAFKDNTNLKKVTIGKNVTSIERAAFRGCANLKKICIESEKVIYVDQNAFQGIKATARFLAPHKKLSAYRSLLEGKGQGSRAVVIDSVKKIAIDAGHQQRENSSREPIGPGASSTKLKVSGGAIGVRTGTPEYDLNLKVAKKLRRELKSRGYEVVMIRSSNDVNISNRERAQTANESGADIHIHIHADSIAQSSVRGASIFCPSPRNPYVGYLNEASRQLSENLIDHYCSATGIRDRGLTLRDDLTGINWSTIPVCLIELGFLSNPQEDVLMQQAAMQEKMAEGIADGIDAYFWK